MKTKTTKPVTPKYSQTTQILNEADYMGIRDTAGEGAIDVAKPITIKSKFHKSKGAGYGVDTKLIIEFRYGVPTFYKIEQEFVEDTTCCDLVDTFYYDGEVISKEKITKQEYIQLIGEHIVSFATRLNNREDRMEARLKVLTAVHGLTQNFMPPIGGVAPKPIILRGKTYYKQNPEDYTIGITNLVESYGSIVKVVACGAAAQERLLAMETDEDYSCGGQGTYDPETNPFM